MSKNMSKKTKEQLERENIELRGQLAYVYGVVYDQIDKVGDDLFASGVLLRMTALGGRELIMPVVIRDGLSQETIAAIKKDIAKSYKLATQCKFE
jgi:hypothetical protein